MKPYSVTLAENALVAVDSLMERSGHASRAEVIAQAIIIYDALTEKIQSGVQEIVIQVLPEGQQAEKVERISMPRLSRIYVAAREIDEALKAQP